MKRFLAIIPAAVLVLGARGADIETGAFPADTISGAEVRETELSQPPSLFGGKRTSLGSSHFTWGADLGTGIDMTTSDMTFVDLHAYLGYKSRAVRFAGIGAGINTMMNNSSRSYPVYAMLRTSFSAMPRLCFMDLRLGAAFNNFYEFKSQTDLYASVGLGITLASGRRFSSHLIIGYTFMPVRNLRPKVSAVAPPEGADAVAEPLPVNEPRPIPDLHYASIRIGCAF